MSRERKILFLFSVPRSGSTVLQDYLATRLEGAVTAPETWIVPFMMASRNELSFSPIGLEAARLAESNFGSKFFDKHLFVGIESFFSSLLDAVPDATIFVEKTPRNVFYHSEISEFLPCAEKIVLVRHPIDIALSSFDYFCHGRPNLARVSIDLHQGIDAMADIVRAGSGILVRYEDFIENHVKSLHEDLRRFGFVLCKNNPLHNSLILRADGMGDEKFKAAQGLNSSSSYKYEAVKISLVTYFVLCSLLKRKSYLFLLEKFYSDQQEEVQSRLWENVNRLGVLDLFSLIGGGLSSMFNLKVGVFKFRRTSPWAYLR